MKNILVTAILPYFIEKENSWFEKNIKRILESTQTHTFWQDNILFFKKGDSFDFFKFLRKIDELGYEKVFKVEQPGEFAQRGGIIDIFPINLNYPVRIEFLGNEIENIEKIPSEPFHEEKTKKILKKKLKSQRLFSDIKKIRSGDYLVHLDHGIGKFDKKEAFGNKTYYVLEYAQKDKLYIPVGLEKKLSRYTGFKDPKISRLGSLAWQKKKRKARKETEKLARELLNIYSEKETIERTPYVIDKEMESKLKSGFVYEETPDQIQTLNEIKEDMKKEKPMDRVVCGDVGFGKTEITLRASVIASTNNRQTALIAPTTILANQHFNNFKNRLSDIPVNVSLLTRLQNKKEQEKIKEGIRSGKIDIIIGTHRLLSSDIDFKNLQLLIIDDEQRFGVKQKEKLRKRKSKIDVLSLSATPIPRTLYSALSSFKDISLIQTPPPGRLPIKTYVSPYNKEKIKNAIDFELKRNGQVYFLHNRVETIKEIKKKLKKLSPKSRISIIHGKMKEKDMMKTMDEFQKGETDILIATTIIENGLDLPKVNTLIVENATLLGLAQAYQIRGRVGRAHTQSFAYFFYPPRSFLPKAQKRLEALEKTTLGSGYQIALKDLEMRGAGNILGREQSGSINQIGLNLYCQMISESMERLKD